MKGKTAQEPTDESGITPVEYKVLVLPDTIEEVTSGGIFLPATAQDKRQAAEEKGTVVAIGGNCFSDPIWLVMAPNVGSRVIYERYAGKEVEGKDGKKYRIMNDKDIDAIITF